MWSAVQCALEGRVLKKMKRLASVALIFAALASPLGRLGAQEPPLPTASVSAAPVSSPPPQPPPVPLADVITQADEAQATLEQPLLAVGPAEGTIATRDLPAVTQEIRVQLAETTQLLKPGVLLETLSEWRCVGGNWASNWAFRPANLTNRANLIDKQIALLPDLQATSTKNARSCATSDTPPEIRQQIDNVLAKIGPSRKHVAETACCHSDRTEPCSRAKQKGGRRTRFDSRGAERRRQRDVCAG